MYSFTILNIIVKHVKLLCIRLIQFSFPGVKYCTIIYLATQYFLFYTTLV